MTVQDTTTLDGGTAGSTGVLLSDPAAAAAIIGASRPEQVHDNVKAAGVTLDADVLARIDEALGDVVERDPSKVQRGA